MSLRTLPSQPGRQSQANSRAARQHEQILDGYNKRGKYLQAFDEMFDAQGTVRGP